MKRSQTFVSIITEKFLDINFLETVFICGGGVPWPSYQQL